MTKMTDDDVAETLSQLTHGAPTNVRERLTGSLRAHIAALTAERDEWEESHAQATVERDSLRAEVQELVTERDALRGRVTALEAERNEKAAWALNVERAHAAVVSSRRRAESRLAAIRQRAEMWKETNRLDSGTHAAIDFVLGDAAPPSEMDGLRGEMAENPDSTSEADQPLPEGPLSAEPTTAEAFATVREALTRQQYDGPERALSLLERRMGAMGRAVRDLREVAFLGPSEPKGTMCAEGYREWRERIRRETNDAALTDAPPVFTLENNPLRAPLLHALTYIGDRSAGSGLAWRATIEALGLDEDATTGEVLIALR